MVAIHQKIDDKKVKKKFRGKKGNLDFPIKQWHIDCKCQKIHQTFDQKGFLG